jgi:hypothetical protein
MVLNRQHGGGGNGPLGVRDRHGAAPPPTSEGQEASLPQPAEAGEATAAAAATGVAEGVVGEEGSSPPHSVAVGADEVRVPDEPAAALQERVSPEDTTRVASPEIQEAEETGWLCCRVRQAAKPGPSSSTIDAKSAPRAKHTASRKKLA